MGEEIEVIKKTYTISEESFKRKLKIKKEETITSIRCGGLFNKGLVKINVEIKKR